MAPHFSIERGSLTPPGTIQAGWTFLPPSSWMIVWPIWRRRMPSLARSGCLAITPKTFRVAGVRVPAKQQVGGREVEERQGVRLHQLREVHQPAELIGRRRDGDAEQLVAGLGGSEQVADRADAAGARREGRHLAVGAALAELLEATELGQVELGVRRPSPCRPTEARYARDPQCGSRVR